MVSVTWSSHIARPKSPCPPSCPCHPVPKRKELSSVRELAQSKRRVDSPRRLISIVTTQAMTRTPIVDVLNSDAGGTRTKELVGLTSSSSGPSVHPLSGPHLIFRLFADVTSRRARIIPPDFFTPGQASKYTVSIQGIWLNISVRRDWLKPS